MRYENALSFSDFMKGVFTILVVVFFLLSPQLYKKIKESDSSAKKVVVSNAVNV